MELFNDQVIFTNDIIRAIGSGYRKLCCQGNTGSGKTVIFSNISSRYWNKYQQSVLIFVHREELLQQTRRTLYDMFGISAVAITAGMKFIPPAAVYVGMVESTFKRLHKLHKIGLVIVDETHRGEFNKVHDEFKDAIVLGFTATPIASNIKKPLKLYYEEIICGPQISYLISQHRLSQNITYCPKEVVNRLELQKKGNDFDEVQMGNMYSKVKYVSNTVQAYERWCLGEKTIIYNCNIAHNELVCAELQKKGYNARSVSSNNTTEDRNEVMKWFKECEDGILCNVDIATTGNDVPDILNVIVNRATMSLVLWLQMTGRGGRYIKNKKDSFRIIDMGGNAITHGDWSMDRDWKFLFHNPPKPGKGGVPPYKECVSCMALIHAGAMVCPICGAQQPHGRVPMEQELNEFVVITKGIDVRRLAEQNSNRKQYYFIFLLSRIVAESIKNSGVLEINNEVAIFAAQTFHMLAKQWAHNSKKKYQKWMRQAGEQNLYRELLKYYPNWQTNLIQTNNDHSSPNDQPIRQAELY